MHAPAFPSVHYRSLGYFPIYRWGLVLWVTPQQYQQLRGIADTTEIPDATDEQIAKQDLWYEQALREQKEENVQWSKLFRLMGGTT